MQVEVVVGEFEGTWWSIPCESAVIAIFWYLFLIYYLLGLSTGSLVLQPSISTSATLLVLVWLAAGTSRQVIICAIHVIKIITLYYSV